MWLFGQTNPTAVSFGATLQQYKTKTKRYESDKKKIDVEAKENHPKKTAAAISSAKIKDRAEHDDSDND